MYVERHAKFSSGSSREGLGYLGLGGSIPHFGVRRLCLGLVSGLAVELAQGVFACLGSGGGNAQAVLGIYHHCPGAQIRYIYFLGWGTVEARPHMVS